MVQIIVEKKKGCRFCEIRLCELLNYIIIACVGIPLQLRGSVFNLYEDIFLNVMCQMVPSSLFEREMLPLASSV